MPPKTKGRLVAEQFLRANPEIPARQLARILCKERPKLFTNVERARTMIRTIVGAKGSQAPTPDLKRAKRAPGSDRWAKLPKGLGSYDEWKPYPLKGTRVLWLGDVHVPYHDSVALKAALDFGLERECDHILLAGDFMDFHSISRFNKDPEDRHELSFELFRGREVLESIRDAFPKARMTFMYGNHEDRLQNFLWNRAPELKDIHALELPVLLDFKKYKIDEVPQMRLVRIGKLVATHGHELRGGGAGGVNPARSLWLKGRETAICGHWHRRSAHSEPSTLTRAHRTACWSVGCLCFLSPDFMPYNKWGHGFAIIEFNAKTGFFRVDNREILDGVVY